MSCSLEPVTQRDQQREATRRRIAEVAADVLTQGGGTPPTTVAVQRAAGIGRGTLLHHYPTRAQLLAAAVATLRAGNAASVRDALAIIDADDSTADPVERAVSALAVSALRPEMSAEYGLWAASRCDQDLREALRGEEREARNSLHEVLAEAFGAQVVAHLAFERIAALTVQFLRGLAITHALRDDSRRAEVLIQDWIEVVHLMLDDTGSAQIRDRS